MRKTIRVGKKHIKAGKRGRVTMCPIALAIKDQLRVKPDVKYAGFPLDTKCSWYVKRSFQESVDRFIQRFDLGLAVKPFSFVVAEYSQKV